MLNIETRVAQKERCKSLVVDALVIVSELGNCFGGKYFAYFSGRRVLIEKWID